VSALTLPRYRLVVNEDASRRIRIGRGVVVDFDAGTLSRNDGVAIAMFDEHTHRVASMVIRRESGRVFHLLEGVCAFGGSDEARALARKLARAHCNGVIAALRALLATAHDLAPDVVGELSTALAWARAAWKEANAI